MPAVGRAPWFLVAVVFEPRAREHHRGRASLIRIELRDSGETASGYRFLIALADRYAVPSASE
jgi:hypothetical protein